MNESTFKPPREGSNLAHENYDFTEVSHGEKLQACCYYEYARECQPLRELVACRRKEIEQYPSKNLPPPWVGGQTLSFEFLGNAKFTETLIDCPRFPDQPWQRLQVSDQNIFLGDVNGPINLNLALDKDPALEICLINDCDPSDLNHLTTASWSTRAPASNR